MELISIVICSRGATISDDLALNIKTTIGADHEFIIVNNSYNKYSIFQAYNNGIRRSNGGIICFIHDDVKFITIGWGNIIKEIFSSNDECGLIGIAGGKIKFQMPSAWWDSGGNSLKLIQQYQDGSKKFWDHGFGKEELVEVAAIDGVFMAMKKDERIHFDERLDGFHNYDLNLSILHHRLNKKVLVTKKILLEHFSSGRLNESWCKSTSRFHKLYKKALPVYIGSRDPDFDSEKKEFTLGLKFILLLIEHKLYSEAFYWWFMLLMMKPLSKAHYVIFRKIIKLPC